MARVKNMHPLVEMFWNNKDNKEKRAFYYCRKSDNRWVSKSWSEYVRDVRKLAGFLKERGIEKSDSLAILSENRPEWLVTDFACLSSGIVSVPLHINASKKDQSYMIHQTEAKVLVVSSVDLLKKLKLSGVHFIISYQSKAAIEGFESEIPIISFEEIMEADSLLDKPADLTDKDILTIVYTSGTTGLPKGVVHNYGGVYKAVENAKYLLNTKSRDNHRFFSFLPLSHMAERTLVSFGSMACVAEVSFARSLQTIGRDLRRCRPTVLLGVPRVWEKLYDKIHHTVDLEPVWKKKAFYFLLQLAITPKSVRYIKRSYRDKFFVRISDALVGKSLRKSLGLSEVELLLTGSAPTQAYIKRFFAAAGLYFREVYGLTENFCLGAVESAEGVHFDGVGYKFPHSEIKLAEDKELLIKAPWLFDKYHKNEKATEEAYNSEGWFQTGDYADISSDGLVRIDGRKKDLIKNSWGKFVAPLPLEEKLEKAPL